MSEQPPSRPHTILVVEDEPWLRGLFRRVLEEVGLTVLEAASGEEALALASQYEGAIDVLLTDVRLPGMSGRRVSEELRQTRPEVRVLFMSGYAQGQIDPEDLGAGDAPLLHKPFSNRQLACAIASALPGHPGGEVRVIPG